MPNIKANHDRKESKCCLCKPLRFSKLSISLLIYLHLNQVGRGSNPSFPHEEYRSIVLNYKALSFFLLDRRVT